MNQRKAVRDAKSAVALILISETYQKWLSWYHWPRSFKVSIKVFAFLYVKANSKENCEEISFPSSFSEKCWSQHFCWDSILHENGAFRKQSSNQSRSGHRLSILKMKLFEDDDVTIITWFSCQRFPQTQIQNNGWFSPGYCGRGLRWGMPLVDPRIID